ncbi:MAG: gamma carbonic anhydrase family protein [Legionellales bacterium]|nr:gamma carbonic anhydrase family protein [Legionellales bacterium]
MTLRSFEKKFPILGKNVYIDEHAVVIGNVTFGDHSSVWPMAVIRGDVNVIKIGAYTNIQDGAILHVTHASEIAGPGYPLEIGNYVTIGHQAVLHGCKIDDFCLLGIGSRILDGAYLEPYTLVGAGCLVPPHKVLESGFLWIGQPARKARPLTQAERDYFKYSAEYYAKLHEQYQLT